MQPLAARHLWFVGIGGAGMSALALVAHARGATVGGSDQTMTAYAAQLQKAGITVAVGHSAANVPDGYEVIVSSAIAPSNPEVAGRATTSRGALLSEIVNTGRSIVVAGTHGKTTTAAMIAYGLDRFADDPTFLIGGDVPQLGGNGRAGSGWIVAEGDESDRSLELLRPSVAVITNVELDHHPTFASTAEVEELFAGWCEALPAGTPIVDGRRLGPLERKLAVPGLHNRQNAACAVEAVVAAGHDRGQAASALADFRGVKRRLEFHGEHGGVRLYDDYAHHPTEVAAALRALRETLDTGERLLVLFQPHLFSRTLHFAREFAVALAAADVVCITAIYPAREEPLAGVTARLVVDALARVRPGMDVRYGPVLEDAAALVVEPARPGDLLVAVGAGDVDQAISRLGRLLER